MNIKQARYIKTIAECGTVTAAAKQLYVSQPSLSQMLHQVEDELGLPIFDRSVSPFRLTYAGEKYVQAADRILAANAQLEMQIRELKHENSGRIRLGVSISRALQILPKVFPMFRAQYPDVQIELTECGSAGLEELLISGQVDMALAAIDPVGRNITYELIERETIGILAGRDSQLARRLPSGTPIALTDAKGDNFVSLTKDHSSRLIQDKLFRKYDFNPRILLETNSMDLCRRVTLETDSCMIMPSVYLDNYVLFKQGEFFPLADYENTRHFYACFRKGDFVPKYSRDFVQMVGAVLETHPSPTSLER